MATSKTNAKPVAQKPAVKAAEKPVDGVTIKDVAAKLGRTPKAVRASIRRLRGGAQVGKGGHYVWKSFNDPDLKKLMNELQGSEKA